jgi:hypothetical protein
MVCPFTGRVAPWLQRLIGGHTYLDDEQGCIQNGRCRPKDVSARQLVV